MDPVQTRALTALEQFLLLSKSANSPRAAADLISQATSARDTFVFAELLNTPAIQNLRNAPDFAGHLRLLEIFSWGTWADYATASNLPSLNERQAQKLRLLSLLTLASQPASTPSHLTYSSLAPSLALSSAQALEALVTDAIYRGLLTGTLDPARQVVSITSVSPLRDLAPGSIPTLLSTLATWSDRCGSAMKDLEFEILRVKTHAKQQQAETARFDKRLEIASKSVEGGGKKTAGIISEDEFDKDSMDLDEGITVTKGLSEKGAVKKREKA